MGQLQNAGVVLQQIASMCQADPRLARIAGLFGASLLADRICSTANASVNFADGAVGSAAAQVNRSAAAVTEELWSMWTSFWEDVKSSAASPVASTKSYMLHLQLRTLWRN